MCDRERKIGGWYGASMQKRRDTNRQSGKAGKTKEGVEKS